MSELVGIPVAGGELPAYLYGPAGGSGPGIVLLQEIFGVSPYVHRRAADLAALGYVVLVPRIYWRLGVDAVPDGPQMLADGLELVGRLDWSAAVADAVAAVAAVRARPQVRDGVGVVGFCFGGGLGYAAAAAAQSEGAGIDALVSYYGSALPMLVDAVPVVDAPSLHHFGASDAYIDTATVAHIREVVTSGEGGCEFHIYPGADHAFDNPDFVLHHPQAGALAWERTVDFLGRALPA